MTDPTSLDEHVKRMRDAETDAERAEVLLSAPVLTLLRWRDRFEHFCRRAAFDEGVTYLHVLRETMSKPRFRGNLGGAMPMAGATTTLIGVIERARP
jgi:hypothetical protein